MRIYHNDPINVQFIVRPKLTTDPSVATPGTRVTITGTGFPSRDTGSITFDDKSTVVKFTTNKIGSFTTSMKVPDTTTGTHSLTAESPRLYSTATGTLKVVEETPTPEPEPEPVPEPEPEPVPEPEPEPEPEPISDTPVDTICPPSPSPVTPMGQKFGVFGPQFVTFFWNPVADENGVSYTIEIADDTSFSQVQPGYSKTGIRQSSYTIMLEPGIYYWRIQATDGYGNKSRWGNAPYGFTVSELSIALQDFLAFWKRTFSS